MDEILEWVEESALESLRTHVQTADTLAKEANITLTVLMAMLSGAFAYSIKASDHSLAAVILTIYLFALCVVLVYKCMMIEEIPAIRNEPRNLLQEGYKLDVLRKVELRNMQERIDGAARRNATTAQWLNRVRIGALCAPLIYVASICALAQVHRVVTAAAAG